MTSSRRSPEPAAGEGAGGRDVRVLIAAVVALAVVVFVLFPKSGPPATTGIPGTGVTFVKPATWRVVGHDEVLDPNWAASLKARYPGESAFFDGWVSGVALGDIDLTLVIDPPVQGGDPDGWVDVQVTPTSAAADDLPTLAAESVDRQPVLARDATAVSLKLPGGLATRLDWAYDLFLQTGELLPVHVRSYWLIDGGSLVVIQLTTFGDGHDAAVASFDGTAMTLHWSAAAGSARPS